MYKILTFTPVWRRPEIFEICLQGLKRLQAYQPEVFNIRPFFIVSEPEAADQVERYGFDHMYCKNDPLGAKKNTGLKYAYKHFDFDYIMEMGSDDLVTNTYLHFIEAHMAAGTFTFHPSNVWFIDTRTGKTAYFTTEKILGAGRLISRKAIATMMANKSDIWINEKNRGMDTCSFHALNAAGFKNVILKTDNIYTLDLKSDENINPIMSLNPSHLSAEQILKHFPDEAPQIYKLLK